MKRIRLSSLVATLCLSTAAVQAAPVTPASIHTPFTHNVGIDFATNMTNWYPAGDRQAQINDSQNMLEGIVKHFKLIRVYSMFVPGWNNDVDPATQALANVMNTGGNSDVEAIIGTQNSFDKFCTSSDLSDTWVSKLVQTFGSNTSRIKAVLLGNEVNAQGGIDATKLESCMKNMKQSMANAGLGNIPISVSFNLLPRDNSPNSIFDPLVNVIVNNWDNSWNGGYPFVMYDPYPDAITTPQGTHDPKLIAGKAHEVFNDWYSDIVNNYASRFNHSGKTLQVFIAETGAEGSLTQDGSTLINNALLQELDSQYKSNNGKTVPTIMEEAANQSKKAAGQQMMGLFDKDGNPISGLILPAWTTKHR
ncbi:hypothetical protein [Dongshaea marina]|uniref:hypothetical protein n=1 Tax=Dongshaea marina TaxID=2047966 RepID=UPI00131F23FB|nr:hypothetical protein [Dongshaea marina]